MIIKIYDKSIFVILNTYDNQYLLTYCNKHVYCYIACSDQNVLWRQCMS